MFCCVHLSILISADAISKSFAELDPALGGKVGGLGHIEPVVETRVISMREHHYHRSRFVDNHYNIFLITTFREVYIKNVEFLPSERRHHSL